ncbi:hypothetical protein JNX00_08455 [Hydrogenophaga sp. YM1]|uniref:hypothetical protein n=1 Tax=Hydrogenophaga sp. YM1 TaxID=2806262 RepID=UPI0019599396|nr:hypothetical protein [Hydrogenophaga sp. YM1]QRR35876.1 hypothetical protein JNX00_08455 [Hydrogenophaga sp. YM1]
MTHSPFLRRLLLGAALVGAAHAAQAQNSGQKEVLTDPQARLDFVRGLPYSGERPTLAGFSPAQPIKGFAAPAGQHEQTQAYRSASGCVAFFFPPGPEVADVAFKWSGPACKGQPVEGRGELQVRRRMGENTAVAWLRGEFKRGMLTGEASKRYFYFDGKGQALPGVHVMAGSFANSVLHGKGTASWSGAPDARPAAWFREGVFKDGSLQGMGVLARLRPFPGVEADIHDLVFAEDGEIYIEQARMNGGRLLDGTLYFENDPVPWGLELASWREAAPEAARLNRLDAEQGVALVSACVKWRFEAARLVCERGSVSSGTAAGSIGLNEGGFTVRLPVHADGVPFRPLGEPKLSVGLGRSEIPVRCDSDLRQCSGQGVLTVLGSALYWFGDIEWVDGALRPARAALYAHGSKLEDSPDPERDRRLATCERFDDALRCQRGKVFYNGGGSYYGGWRYTGVSYRGEGRTPPAYVAQGEQDVLPFGWGQLTYRDGSWAEVHHDSDGDIDEVGKCDVPSESASYRCHLDGQTVMFQAQGQGERRVRQAEAPVTVPAFRMPDLGGGSRPAVPQRPVFVLPGMR